MFEEETEPEHGVSVSQSPGLIGGHLQQDGDSSLPPSPSHSELSTTSPRHLHPPSAHHRRRSGSVPCRRTTHDQRRSSLRRPGGRRGATQRQATGRCTSSLVELPTLSIPRIVVNGQTQQPPDPDTTERPARGSVDDRPTAFRPRRQTVSALHHPGQRLFPSFVLPSSRTLSLSVDLSSARLVYSGGEFIRLLLQRTDVSDDDDDDNDDASVSHPPL